MLNVISNSLALTRYHQRACFVCVCARVRYSKCLYQHCVCHSAHSADSLYCAFVRGHDCPVPWTLLLLFVCLSFLATDEVESSAGVSGHVCISSANSLPSVILASTRAILFLTFHHFLISFPHFSTSISQQTTNRVSTQQANSALILSSAV